LRFEVGDAVEALVEHRLGEETEWVAGAVAKVWPRVRGRYAPYTVSLPGRLAGRAVSVVVHRDDAKLLRPGPGTAPKDVEVADPQELAPRRRRGAGDDDDDDDAAPRQVYYKRDGNVIDMTRAYDLEPPPPPPLPPPPPPPPVDDALIPPPPPPGPPPDWVLRKAGFIP
jgi:hypothetical protein